MRNGGLDLDNSRIRKKWSVLLLFYGNYGKIEMIMFGKVILAFAPVIVSAALSSLARWKSVRASSGSTSTAQHS